MRWGDACKTPEGALTHLVAFSTAWTWCGCKTDPLDVVPTPPTCLMCIVIAADWSRRWQRR